MSDGEEEGHGPTPVMSNWLYLLGSVCFAAGTILHMFNK